MIIVGPLNEAVVDQLEQDFPHVFQRCIPEKMKGSLSMMERGLQELKFVDFRRRGNHFESTTVTAIKQLCDKVSVMFDFYLIFILLIQKISRYWDCYNLICKNLFFTFKKLKERKVL